MYIVFPGLPDGILSITNNMGALFSSGCTSPKAQRSDSVRKSDQITDKDRAILDLKNARDRLKRYRKKVGCGVPPIQFKFTFKSCDDRQQRLCFQKNIL